MSKDNDFQGCIDRFDLFMGFCPHDTVTIKKALKLAIEADPDTIYKKLEPLKHLVTYQSNKDGFSVPDEKAIIRNNTIDEIIKHLRDPLTKSALIVAPILKGVGKINGDGWKDSTKKGEIIFVWNQELPRPFKEGQYPRLGYESYSAGEDQYNFSHATVQDIPEIKRYLRTPKPTINENRVMDLMESALRKVCIDNGNRPAEKSFSFETMGSVREALSELEKLRGYKK